MNDPKRLLDAARAGGLERSLLESAMAPDPTSDQCAAMWSSLAGRLPGSNGGGHCSPGTHSSGAPGGLTGKWNQRIANRRHAPGLSASIRSMATHAVEHVIDMWLVSSRSAGVKQRGGEAATSQQRRCEPSSSDRERWPCHLQSTNCNRWTGTVCTTVCRAHFDYTCIGRTSTCRSSRCTR